MIARGCLEYRTASRVRQLTFGLDLSKKKRDQFPVGRVGARGCRSVLLWCRRLQVLSRHCTEVEAEYAATQLRERELQLENDRLASELARVTKEVECCRTSVGRRDLEMKDLNMTIDERVCAGGAVRGVRGGGRGAICHSMTHGE